MDVKTYKNSKCAQKFNQLVYSLSKCPLQKNLDQGSLCIKWGVRVSHVEKPPVLAKETFFATTRVVPFFSGNSKGDTLSIFRGRKSSEAFNNGNKNLFHDNPTDLAHLHLRSNHKATPLSRSSLLPIMISSCCLGFVPYVSPLGTQANAFEWRYKLQTLSSIKPFTDVEQIMTHHHQVTEKKSCGNISLWNKLTSAKNNSSN